MNTMYKAVLFALLGIALVAAKEVSVKQKVEGQVHANWHYDLTEDAKPASAFDLTRAYFGYKMTLNKNFTGRVMLDIGRINPVTSVSVDSSFNASTKKDSRYVAYLKYGYLEWKNLIPKTAFVVGLHGLSQFKYQEKFWGYRYIYKSFMDKYKYGSSADLGLSLKAKPVDKFAVNVSVINGEGYKKPQDLDGKYKAALGTEIHIVEGLSTYLYGDVMPYDDAETQFTLAGFIGYKLKKVWRLGAEYNFQGNNKGKEESELHGVSLYTNANIKKVDIFARSDLATKDSWESLETVILLGLQYAPIKNLRIAPNFQITLPAADDADPKPKIFINGYFKF